MKQSTSMDLSNRNIRVALTSACNFTCAYCDGPKGVRNPNRPGAMEDFRSKPLKTGAICTDVYLKIIEILHSVGFGGIALTGGEPFLNKEWDVIANHSRDMGLSRINITTNGMLLEKYIEKQGALPESLTLLNISLDTYDANQFRLISGGNGDLETIMRGLRLVKKHNPKLPIRANKVGLKSTANSIPEYVKFCDKSGVIDEINLLSLIRKSDRDNNFFKKEFIHAQEIIQILSEQLGCQFFLDSKLEFQAKSPGGLRIIVKDTNLTMRNKECDTCSMYCQEGFYTIRVATDGTIMTCPDYTAKQSPIEIIDGIQALNNGSLFEKIKGMVDIIVGAKQQETLNRFFRVYNIPYKG